MHVVKSTLGYGRDPPARAVLKSILKLGFNPAQGLRFQARKLKPVQLADDSCNSLNGPAAV